LFLRARFDAGRGVGEARQRHRAQPTNEALARAECDLFLG